MKRLPGFSFARSILGSLSALVRDRRGVGGVEFAIVAPLLLMLYLGAFEISLGFTVARKVARASSAVADIISQQTDVDKALLDNMRNVALSIVAPYDSTGYTLRITGIQVTGTTSGKVVWSRDQNGAAPYTVNSTATVPAELDAVNAFVVRTELIVPHDLLLFAPGLESSTLKTIDLSKTSYYRQRFGDTIKCTDC
ncbi:TadE/TadG family type IV pilus assembly protein [Sinorhizobium mexicanum]|uniref:Pilus assembly protein n=1 Tax=Sinorhizobium mexicanum TaxID=375549 RepID=A0A859QLR2_9HYPH|nr:TadE/TadG family type IV pilus assembly protein [Sinorhizobium mexicanum]MBP1887937.1 Flp pilus assembly protein TadG [Sinorhizobium mexicanum]QLL60099.1 pilus assembly protein [Sinorhizobium mexicanum]